MNKKNLIFVLLGAICGSIAHAETPPTDDQVVIYDMKADPTVATFLGVPSAPGFYGLELDELKDEAFIFYKIDDAVYRAETDMKIKGDQLILKYRKNRKTFVRAAQTSATGATRDVVYPVECPPERGGWLHGPSFGRHIVTRGDEKAERLVVSGAHLEFELAQERCGDSSNDCGPTGCKEWDVAVSTAKVPVIAKTPVVSTAPAPAPLSKALADAKLSEAQILATYQNDIDTVLPPSLTMDVAPISAGYRVSNLPYPGVSDSFSAQGGLKVGVLSRKYLLEDKVSTMTVEIEPLLPDFQAPLPNKCGTWSSDPGKVFFDVRGQPAIYAQTATDGSYLYACGKTVSISVQTVAPRTKEVLAAFLEALPIDQIERLIGSAPAK